MQPLSAPALPQPTRLVKAIFLTGLVAGTLDLVSAIIQFILSGGKSPLLLLQFIASGAFGREAFTGGAGMAVIGGFFHYCIALVFTALYFVAYPYLPWLGKHKVVAGLLYGIWVWAVMNFVVLPLSQAPMQPFALSRAAIGMLIIMLMIGLPISLFAHRYYSSHGGRRRG